MKLIITPCMTESLTHSVIYNRIFEAEGETPNANPIFTGCAEYTSQKFVDSQQHNAK